MCRFCPAVGVGQRTMTMPCRGASQLSDTWKVITPVPVPDSPPVMVIHDAFGLAVQVHPDCVVIVAVRLPGTDMHGLNSTGVTEYSHATGGGGGGGGCDSPDCVTVNDRSPTAIVLVRDDVSLLRSTAYETVPFPLPGLPDVTRNHVTALVAAHSQPPGALTAKLAVASSLLNDALGGEMSIVQGTTPSSRTATERPAMVSVPLRSAVVVLGVTLTLTTPPAAAARSARNRHPAPVGGGGPRALTCGGHGDRVRPAGRGQR